MQRESLKKLYSKLRLPVAAAAGALIGALLLYLALTLLLPLWIEKKLNGAILGMEDSRGIRCDSLNIGLFGAELGRLKIGSGDPPPLMFESCSLRYNPLSLLLARRISRITLSGLDINVAMKEGRLSLEGLSFGRAKDAPAKQDQAPQKRVDISKMLSEMGSLPVAVDCFEVRNAELNINSEELSLVVPFEITLTPADESWSMAEATIDVSPNGQRLKGSFKASKAGDRLAARIWTPKSVRLESIPFGYMMPAGSSLYGNLELEANAVMGGPDAKIEDISVDASFDRLKLRCGQFRAACAQDSPATLKLRHGEGKGSLEISGIRVGGATPFEMKNSSSIYSFERGVVKATTGVSLCSSGEKSFLAAPANLLLESWCAIDRTGRLELHGSGRLAGENPVLELKSGDFSLSSRAPTFDFQTFSAKDGAREIDALLKLPNPKLEASTLSAAAELLTVHASAGSQGPPVFGALFEKASLKAGNFVASLPKMSFEGQKTKNALTGVLSFDGASGMESSSRMALEGISGKIPLALPLTEGGEPGVISVKSIKLENSALGALSAKLLPIKSGLKLSGEFSPAKIPGMKLLFSSENKLSGRSFSSDSKFSIPDFKIEKPLDLGSIHPKAQGVKISGEFSLSGEYAIDWSGPSGSMRLKTKNCDVSAIDGTWAASGLNASIEFPNLPLISSAPSQKASFEKARFGKLELSDGQASMRVDGPKSFFVESFKASWCGGKLRTQAFSFQPGKQDYDLTVICDRVSISKFLSQLGVDAAEGEGSINGTIPLSLKDGELSFHDAFLCSTPGESGAIRIDDDGLLTAGLQEGSQEYVNLDIAREALKGFSYNWTKISVDTQGDNLRIKFQLDGKPLLPLPFRIEDERYVRDDSAKTEFQGVKLDLNFNLPLSKVLGLGGNFKKILQQGVSAK